MTDSNLFVGISGVDSEIDEFDFGQNITLTRTYAHLMAPFLLAFTRPLSPGQAHPAPWAAATGGLGFDMILQLSIPGESVASLPCPNTSAAWWIVALLRLRAGPKLRAPAISNHPFAKETALLKDLRIHPLEVDPHQLNIDPEARRRLSSADLEWTKKHWQSSLKLLESPEFSLLAEAVDQAVFNRHPQLALLQLWSGIEEVFSPSKTELRYRISSLIAAYIEPPGHGRLTRQKGIAKLYDARSTAAHGRAEDSIEPLWDTYDLARQALVQMITDDHVPSKTELEERMFGAGP